MTNIVQYTQLPYCAMYAGTDATAPITIPASDACYFGTAAKMRMCLERQQPEHAKTLLTLDPASRCFLDMNFQISDIQEIQLCA